MKVHRITGRHLFVDDTGAAVWIPECSTEEAEQIVDRIITGATRLNLEVLPNVFSFVGETVFAIDFPVLLEP